MEFSLHKRPFFLTTIMENQRDDLYSGLCDSHSKRKTKPVNTLKPTKAFCNTTKTVADFLRNHHNCSVVFLCFAEKLLCASDYAQLCRCFTVLMTEDDRLHNLDVFLTSLKDGNLKHCLSNMSVEEAAFRGYLCTEARGFPSPRC